MRAEASGGQGKADAGARPRDCEQVAGVDLADLAPERIERVHLPRGLAYPLRCRGYYNNALFHAGPFGDIEVQYLQNFGSRKQPFVLSYFYYDVSKRDLIRQHPSERLAERETLLHRLGRSHFHQKRTQKRKLTIFGNTKQVIQDYDTVFDNSIPFRKNDPLRIYECSVRACHQGRFARNQGSCHGTKLQS